MEVIDPEVDGSISLPEPKPSDVASLEKVILRASWRDAQKVLIKKLGKAAPFLLKPVKTGAESQSEISLKSGGTRRCFPVTFSWCCDTPKGGYTSAARHAAG